MYGTFRSSHYRGDPAIGESLCKTGSSGVEQAQKQTPHLILLNVRLPDGSGFDFCRQMRQLALRQPIIMLTAQVDSAER